MTDVVQTPGTLTLAEAARIMREAHADRVLAKFAENPENGCWEWTACQSREGYGRVRWDGDTCQAHRVVYELLVGTVPDGLELDHLCRNTCCVNPAHLEPVDHRENVLRGEGIGVVNAAKTHCVNGHEFTPENVYWNQGKRSCRECGRRATRRWRERTA